MDIRSLILSPAPPPGRKALKMEVKRYTSGTSESLLKDGVTLLMLHGLGQHKEQWEPVVERLYAPQSHCAVSPPIREIWLLEWQSHGQSAVLNEEALKDDPLSALMDQWAHGIAEFIKSDFVKGHRLVGVGYSSGAIALMVSTMYFEKCPYLGCILVEPTIADKDTWQSNLETVIQPGFDLVNKAVTRRRNAWANRDEAHTFFAGRSPWKTWDPRVVELFVKYALKESKDKDGNDCVTRKCPTLHEATALQVNDKAPWAAADQIAKLCGVVPMHAILAELVDSMPRVLRDSAVDKSKGRVVDSITTIPNVGHSVIQALPDVIGSTILRLLHEITNPNAKSHL
ncbi:Alpha/beta hydrolase fold-1 [Mycena belliarum]|uniref:Alpha/beta hydrolase fold-1 n=1 Tax=Mycena belliarum TaxID=1033014 RepID=A0AAD6TU00_9AGAR|nr:Alpha/beta hydrolase fold-1 [Mycena belliae]